MADSVKYSVRKDNFTSSNRFNTIDEAVKYIGKSVGWTVIKIETVTTVKVTPLKPVERTTVDWVEA